MTPEERVAAGIGVLGAADAGELLTLQLAAWVREAINNQALDIPPLHETLADVQAQLSSTTIWGLREHGRLLGTVRTTPLGPGTVLLGRLGVVPDLRGQGLGAALLRFAESQLPATVARIELITGRRSLSNHEFYRRHGYDIVAADVPHGIVTMAKEVRAR